MAAIMKKEARQVREKMYMLILENISDDEVDSLQAFYQAKVPKHIKDGAAEIPYRILTAIACDLGEPFGIL